MSNSNYSDPLGWESRRDFLAKAAIATAAVTTGSLSAMAGKPTTEERIGSQTKSKMISDFSLPKRYGIGSCMG
jgi:hypothetical protein